MRNRSGGSDAWPGDTNGEDVTENDPIACPGMTLWLRHYIGPLLALGLCAVMFLTTQHWARTLDYHAVIATLRRLPVALLTCSVLQPQLSLGKETRSTVDGPPVKIRYSTYG